MRSAFPSKQPSLALLTCVCLSGCAVNSDEDTTITTTESGRKIRTTIKNTWSPDAQAIARNIYNGAWEFHQSRPGSSIVIRLHRHDFWVGTFDGACYDTIVFQLPTDVIAGQTIQLRPVPLGRKAKKMSEYDSVAPMKDGEITAFRYANPMMGWMKRSQLASVKILEISDSKASIHLRLKADMEEEEEFDMNKRFVLKIKPPSG